MDKIYETILDSFEVEKFQTNFQLETLISANDKLTKVLFNLSANEYLDALQKGVGINVNEKIIRGKKVQTRFFLKGSGKIVLARPLNEFDRSVFDVCNSAREAGLIGITRNSLFRVLTGSGRLKPRPNQETAILESLERLMTIIKIDFGNTRDKMPKYNNAPASLLSPILPCKILDNVLVNGQPTTFIKFTDESPLITIARAKKQLISSSAALREIPNQNNTPLVIMIKSYLIRRVLEIIAHQMTPTITLTDIFNHCELINSTKRQQQQARKTITDIMEHLKTQRTVKSFEMIKKAGSYYGISINY